MFARIKPILTLSLVFVLSCAPARVPVPVGHIPAGRAPSTADEQYGHQVLAGITKRYKLDYNHPRYAEVLETVNRLATAANANQQPWHVYLLKDDKFKNAAATRGNHVFIWTAMIDYTKDENELAAILAHEIGHVLALHTDPDPNETIKRLLIGVGAVAVGIAAAHATSNPQVATNAGRIATSLTNSVGEGVLINPYSRKNENEADQIGLFLMADAKFHPQAAANFWKRATEDPSFGSNRTSFFSTHPGSNDRLKNLNAMMPQAMARYRGEQFAPRLAPRVAPLKPAPVNPRVRERKHRSPQRLDSWDIREQ